MFDDEVVVDVDGPELLDVDDPELIDVDNPELIDVDDLRVVLDFGKLVVEFSFSPSISKPKF